MTRAELLLWPKVNRWGNARIEQLQKHIELFTALMPDEETCALWASLQGESRQSGHPLATADAWIAATARQWDLALVTADYSDFEHIADITLIAVPKRQ